MKQLDLFDETLEKKILRMEKWIIRLQREIWFLRETYQMRQQQKEREEKTIPIQLDLLG
jgi:hypothetical protein